MATAATPSPSRTHRLARSSPNAPGSPTGSRRNVPLALFGLLTVIGCALAFALISLSAGERQPVLMVVRDLPAGTVLTARDLAVVRADIAADVSLVREVERETVIGQPIGLPVAARSLLTREVLAPRSFPPAGQAVVGMALKPGRFPPGLAPGAWVRAYKIPGDQLPGRLAAGGDPAALPVTTATVLKVEPLENAEGHVVELQLPKDDVPQFAAAAAAGAVTLALLPVGG